jgi:hypothetical protein
MKNVETILLIILIASCGPQAKKNKSWIESINKSDTHCLAEIERAKNHFKEGRLVYCIYSMFPPLRCDDEMTEILTAHEIEFTHVMASDVEVEGKRHGCYCGYMLDQIENRQGKMFIDSLLYIADSIYISKNLDKIYDYSEWDKPPVFPGDKYLDPTNHSGLQTAFEELVRYPSNYEYRADSISMADAKIYLDIDEQGKAKVDTIEFFFWNHKTNKENFNAIIEKPFEKIIASLIEQTKWTPAKIKSFEVKSTSEIYIYFK